MFARWLFVRISAAEKALREGRLDDACAAAEKEDLRSNPRGQRLLDELVKPLLSRARLHRQAGRFADALADLDRLERLGRTSPDTQALRQQLRSEMDHNVARLEDRRDAYGRAAEALAAGRLETMRVDLERVQDTRDRAELGQELAVRIERSQQLLAQAGAALERGDWLAAARFWQDACQRCGRARETDDFGARLAAAGGHALDTWLTEGRLESLLAARPTLAGLMPLSPGLADTDRLVELCGRAVAQFGAADYAGLRQTLLRLKAGRGAVDWLDRTLAALAEIAAAHEKLLASPLGVYASMPGDTGKAGNWAPGPQAAIGGSRELADARPWRPADRAASQPADPNAIRLDRPLLVLVDNGGSSLIVAGEHVRLGRGGTSSARLGGSAGIEVPLPCDVQSHHADITRRGEDYFLTAYGPVEVNGHRVEHTLLRDGDRIVLGGSGAAHAGAGRVAAVAHAGAARIVFCKPSVKSASAVLRLSHRCRLPQDVSDVVLLSETCLLGPTASSHLRTHDGEVQLVLFERGGALHVRQTAGRDWLSAPARGVVLGETLDFGDVRVTVRPYEA